MYICPCCHEEIPDRVKATIDRCPFCLEPWPEPSTDPLNVDEKPPSITN